MPKKSAERGAGPPQDQEPFLLEQKMEFLPEERVELRKFFETTAWRKVVHNARLSRPAPMVTLPAAFDIAENRRQMNSERLSEMRGWKLCEAALARETIHPQERRVAPKDNFPDGGRIDQALQPTKP